MKTVLKHVVYLEIDSENCDRKLLSQSVQSLFFPEVVPYLQGGGIKHSIKKKIAETCMIPVPKFKFLGDRDLFKQKVEKQDFHLDIEKKRLKDMGW